MNISTIFALTCSVAFVWVGSVQAEIGPRARRSLVVGQTPALPKHLDSTLEQRGPDSALRIKNVRLEAAPPDVPTPSTVLKFDVLNDGAVRVTDLLIQIGIRTKESTDRSRPPQIIVGPFSVAGYATIEAGYTLNYEMLLRNLSPDCSCVADVSITSARPVAEPDSPLLR